jgi:hypothetical protein
MRTQNQLTSFFAIVTLGLTVGTGCKNKDSAAATRPDSASMSASTTARPSQSPYGATGSASGSGGMTAGDSAAAARDAASGVADTAGRAARDTAADAQDAAAAAARAPGATGKSASDAPAPAPAGADASTSTASTTEAQKLLDQASQYIKENKWDLADQSLTKVEQMKPQLPASYGTKIDATRKLFNSAKSGSNLLGGTGATGGSGGAAK